MKVKINILSPGRFHVCDLARELDKNGYDVKFYSFVPSSVTMKYGLPRRCSASVIGAVGLFLLLERRIFKGKQWVRVLRIKVQDYFTGWYMRKCDICISMSGDFVYSLKVAKRHGAVVILERGSKHILEQRRILEAIPSNKGKKPVPDINVKRELAGYEIADFISIAAQHVKDSFLKYNYPEEKLFLNPYGVDLSMFKPLPVNSILPFLDKYGVFIESNEVSKILSTNQKFDLIMVGIWCYRKGCDLIEKAVRRGKYTFLHVGAIGDYSFPQDSNFIHVDAVPQSDLVFFYNLAKVFILPSREEGLALVQAQAMACNLPLIGSPDSGADDLKALSESKEYVTVAAPASVDMIIHAISRALYQSEELQGRRYVGKGFESLTWEAYGKRYAAFLNNVVVKRVLSGGGKFDIIMVGQWSFQKGCDLLIDAFLDTKFTLLHVGALGEIPFPKSFNFVHVDAVPQKDLVFFYNLAKVFVMPSRQDGFGMVYTQAMACCLPIVGSKDSGAPDLQSMVANPEYVIIIDKYDDSSVKRATMKALSLSKRMYNYAGDAIEKLSWSAYGERYSSFIKEIYN